MAPGETGLIKFDWGYGEKGGRPNLRRQPTDLERQALLACPQLAEAASERLKPGTGHVLRNKLGEMLLVYPVRQMTDAQWGVLAGLYAKVLGDCPDECIADAADRWLADPTKKVLPSPAELAEMAKALKGKREFAAHLCLVAPKALQNWDDDHRPGATVSEAEKAKTAEMIERFRKGHRVEVE